MKRILLIILCIFFVTTAHAADPSSWDLLDWDCSSLTGWTDSDAVNGVSEISPAGQLRLDANTKASGNYAMRVYNVGDAPNTFTIEIKWYHDALGTYSNLDRASLLWYQDDWSIRWHWASDGFWVVTSRAVEVGTNLVKYGGGAAWQTWRFLVNKTAGTMDVYLDGDLVGDDISCNAAGNAGLDQDILAIQYGYTTNDMLSHVDYIKIATGLYTPGAASTFVPVIMIY